MKVLKYEIRKIFYEAITYYPDFIVSNVSNIILFLILFQSLGNKNVAVEVHGYILWILTGGVLSEIAIAISTEKQLGTLQNLMVKPNNIMKIMISKTIGWTLLNFLKIIIVSIVLSLLIDFPSILDLRYLYVYIIACLGILGLSLILGSLTLIYTKMASFESILNYVLLFLSGSFINLPEWIYYSNPLSCGSKIIKSISLESFNFIDNLMFILISMIWFIIGYTVFKYIFKRSKKCKWTY